MKQCWSEGELRACLDCELPARDMERLAAHLKECSPCADLCADLKSRAARLQEWMQALPEPEPVAHYPELPHRARIGMKVAAAAVLAASVTVALLPRAAQKPVAPPPVVRALPAPGPGPAPAEVKPAIIQHPAPPRAVPVKPKPKIEYYYALDNEPIETGVVVRVGLNDGQIPADVIVGPDGRARAIRLVSDLLGELK